MNVETFFVMKEYYDGMTYEPPENAPTWFWLEVLTIAALSVRTTPEPMSGRNEWSHLFVHADDNYDNIVRMGAEPEWVYWCMQEFGWNDNSEDFVPVEGHEYVTQKSDKGGYEVLDLSDVGRVVWMAETYKECLEWIEQPLEEEDE